MDSATNFPTITVRVKPDGGFVVEIEHNPKPRLEKVVEMPRQRMIGASRKKQQLCFD